MFWIYLVLLRNVAEHRRNIICVQIVGWGWGEGRQCHRLPICFLTSDLTIRNKNQRTLIVRRAGLSSCCTSLGLSESERPINLEWGRSSIWARMQTGRNQGSGCPTFGPGDKYTDTQVIGKIGQIRGKYSVRHNALSAQSAHNCGHKN